MIRLKSPLRRVVAVTAGALLGVAGAAAIAAAPASAHHPIIDGTGCKLKDGSVQVTWTVRNSERQWDATVVGAWSPAATELTGIVPGAVVPKSGQGELVGQQTVPRNKKLELSVRLEWDKGRSKVYSTRTGVVRVTGKCQTPEPTPTSTPTEEPTPTPSETTPTEEPTTPTPTPSETTPTEEPTPTPSETTPTDEPSESTPPASPTPSQPPVLPEPGEPTFELEQTCDQLTFGIDNPADGVEFTVTLTSEKGEVKTLDAVPGKKTSVSFDAYEGLKVTPSIGDVKDEVVVWEQPKDCEEEGGSGGGLPLTGAAAGGIATGAVLLLGAGAGLFVMARRRKLRFTA
ncbi:MULTISPECIES: cell wall anchor protein [Micromonospora]|uniref:cell wall anchor protein n=1 Tax=Micromonospora TaxID=1873 RepID=UPI001112F636|nr:cell wall anchor protein [Micromonospora yangpuensis]